MTTLTPDLAAAVAACRAAIDDGDDVDDLALLGWADALEEAGDPRAESLRCVAEWAQYVWPATACRPRLISGAWCWGRVDGHIHGSEMIAADLYARLRGAGPDGNIVGYPSRSAAYFALAEALTTA